MVSTGFNSWKMEQNLMTGGSVVQLEYLLSCGLAEQTPPKATRKITLIRLFIFWELENENEKALRSAKMTYKKPCESFPPERGEGGRKCSKWHSKWGHLFMNSTWDFLWEGYSVIRKTALVPPTQNLPNNNCHISSWTGYCFNCIGV